MMLQYIIFDFDGTLADSKEVFISVYNQIAIKHNYRQIESTNLQYLRTLTIAGRCRYLRVPLYRIPFLASEFLTRYKQTLDQVKIFDGINELMLELDKIGIKMAIISSNAESNITGFLSANGIGHISQIYCSTNLFGKTKLINGFLKKFDLRAEQVLYVGDETRDILACKNAGVKIAWVEWGYDMRETAVAARPDYLVSDPSEILNIARELIFREKD